MTRQRYQDGSLSIRGKRKVYVARYYEDVIGRDGSLSRQRRSVVLGEVAEIGPRRAAKARLAEILRPLNRGEVKPRAMLTFEEFLDEHWLPKALPLLKQSTQVSYRCILSRHLRPLFGREILCEIRPARVQEFLLKKYQGGLSWNMVRNLRNVLGAVLRTAVDWGYLEASVLRKVRLPIRPPARQRVVLSPAEFRAVLAELVEPARTMLLLAALTGLRRGELFGLRWGDVDLEKRYLDVSQAVFNGRVDTPKTASSRRRLPLSAPVVELLEGLRPEEVSGSRFVFESRRGTAVRPDNILKRYIHPACERAGLPKIGWHSLRHMHATLLSDLGEPIKTAQAILGHSDLATTLAVYTHSVPDTERRAEERLAAALLDPNGPKRTQVEVGSKTVPMRSRLNSVGKKYA